MAASKNKQPKKIVDFTEKVLFFFSFLLQRSSSSTTTSQGSGEGGSSSKPAQPQTLEELLERQWEQGSQFLMEQASHFDSKLISRVFVKKNPFPFPPKNEFFRQINYFLGRIWKMSIFIFGN